MLKKLSLKYDYTIVLAFEELIKTKDINKFKKLIDFDNIKFIKKSIINTVNKYPLDFKIKHEFNILLTLQEIYSYISDKSEYKIYSHRTKQNDINLVATLDSSKLRNLLNTKI